MAPRSYSLINELRPTPPDNEDSGSNNWKIRVRVTRLCKVYRPTNKSELLYVSTVLIDEEGGYVEATIPGYFWKRFEPKICDGKIYILKNFEIIPNRTAYRVVSDNKIMLKFFYSTFAKAMALEDSTIPIHRFDFVPFDNLDHRRDNHYILTDLYGVVIDEKPGNNCFAIEIENEVGDRVRITLWDQCLANYHLQKEKLTGSNVPTVAVVTSLIVKNYNGYNSISTSSSSSLYLNLDFPEVNTLTTIYSEKSGDFKHKAAIDEITQKDISTLLEYAKTEYKKDLICYCTAKVKCIPREKPWNYQSCFGCTSKPRHRASGLWCDTCKKPSETQTIRYRIELKVQNDTSTTSFVIFDKEAKKLIGQDALTLFDSQPIEDEDDEDYNHIPDLLFNTFVGKEFCFKIRVADYNHGLKRRKSFNVIDISEKCFNETFNGEHTQPKRSRQVHIVDESDDEGSISTSKNKKTRHEEVDLIDLKED
ncbi:replication protein A 70 kDa DNA-binding subunit A-like [Silene latifolia]|uniref:replication protein A 70 kDa DNA-binding subunit A-like n=1 Tax=Silene latifolia TaxID=37657 RepID=UPI003D76FB6C